MKNNRQNNAEVKSRTYCGIFFFLYSVLFLFALVFDKPTHFVLILIILVIIAWLTGKLSIVGSNARAFPVITTIVLFGLGIMLFLSLDQFSKVSLISSNTFLFKYIDLVPLQAVIKEKLLSNGTIIVSLILSPYFWVLWIWRHNDKENDKQTNIIDSLDSEFYKILSLAGSDYEYIAIAGFKRINRYIDLNKNQIEREKLQILFDVMIESTTHKGRYYRLDALKIALKLISKYDIGNLDEIKPNLIHSTWFNDICKGNNGFCKVKNIELLINRAKASKAVMIN